MGYDWGTKHNGVRLGVFWDGIELSADGSKARIKNARIKIDRDVNIADSSNKLSWSGGSVADGSAANINVDGSGEKTIKSCSETWCDLSYTGITHHDFNASLSGINYAGTTISAGASIAYPQRQYDLPAVPTGINWTGSLGNFTVTWPNLSTETAPWSTLDLHCVDYNTGIDTVISVPSPTTDTSMVQTVPATSRYYWYLIAGNASGNTSTSIFISPVTPEPLHTLSMDYNVRLIDETVNFTINNNGSTYKSAIYVDGILIQAPTTATAKTYTFAQETWATRMSSVTSKPLTIILETWTADELTLIGSLHYTLTLNLPTPFGVYAPTAGSPTITEQTTAISTAFGVGTYIQNQSVIRVTHVGAPGVGATITKKEVIVNGLTYDVTITGYKDIPVTWVTAPTAQSRTTDTRMVSSLSSSVVVKGYPYSKPVITNFVTQRVDGSGNPTGSGTQVKFTVDVTATSVNNGGEKNNMKFDVYLAVGGVKSGPALFSKPLSTQLTTIAPYQVSGVIGAANTYSKSASYSFILEANDDLPSSTVTRLSSIPTEIVPLSIGPNGIAVGKVYDDVNQAVDVLGDVKITGDLTVTGAFSGLITDNSLPSRLDTYCETITDWNLAITNGWYKGSNVANAPGGSTAWFIGQVIAHSAVWLTQEVYEFTGDGSSDSKTWRRSINGTAGVWEAWHRVRKTEAELDARYAALAHTHALSDITGTDIPTAANLNTYTTQGLYFQNSNEYAVEGSNYPEAIAGLLEVIQKSTSFIYQRYSCYQGTGQGRVYQRSYYDGAWAPWQMISGSMAAKMYKSTAGPAYSSDTWTKITAFTNTEYADGITVDLTNGNLNILYSGVYDIEFYQRWQQYGSAYYRIGAIMLGTSAPPTGAGAGDGDGILALSRSDKTDWYVESLSAPNVALTAGQAISFWIRSGTASTWNKATDTLVNKSPFALIRRIS